MYRLVDPAHPRPMIPNADSKTWKFVLPAMAFGLAAVIIESPRYETRFLTVNTPAVFGVFLWISVSLEFCFCTAFAVNGSPGAKIDLAQRIARQIYLVCYLMAGARIIRYIVYPLSSGAPLLESMQGLQPYFGYALLALITVKAAARI